MSFNNTYINKDEIVNALKILKPDGELFEIRIVRGKKVISAYFRDPNLAADALSKVDLKGFNVYFTLNKIDGSCYSRVQKDKFVDTSYNNIPTTSDGNITKYEWLLIDLDPERASGTSSSDKEFQEASKIADQVIAFLSSNGFADPVRCISGNGHHLLYRIDLDNTKENVDLIKNVANVVGDKFDSKIVKIDRGVWNPSRISKLYGTLAQKGSSTNERPHRMSRVFNVPNEIGIVSKDAMEKLAAGKKAESSDKVKMQPKTRLGSSKEFDIEAWLTKYGLSYKKSEGSGYTKLVLDNCPFDSSHKAPDSMITIGNGGEIGFKCLHNSCQDKKWKDVRLKFEPDAYDRNKDDKRIRDGWKSHQAQRESLNADQDQEEDSLLYFHRFTEKGKPFETYDIRIVNDIIKNNYIFVMSEKPYIYDGGYYRCDDKGKEVKAKITTYIYEHLITATRVDRVYKLLLQAVGIQQKYETINRYPKHWINFKNGMLDLATMKLLDHSPDYYSINQIPHEWKSQEVGDQSIVYRYLKSFIPDTDDLQMFLEYSGYCLTIDTKFQKMLYIRGKAGIGKSVLLNLMEAAVGQENKSNLKVQNLNDRFSPIFLLGKLVNIYADIPSTEMPDISGIKTITGEDTCRGEYKGGDLVFFKPYCKLLFSANSIPYANDDKTNAYYRRLLILKVDKQGINIKNINQTLLDDIDSFITMITKAAHEAYIRGSISESENSKKEVERLYTDSDSVMAFLVDMTRNDPNARINRKELLKAYSDYCDDHQRQSKAANGFYMSIRDKGYNERKSGGIYYFDGIALIDVSDFVPSDDNPF